MLPTPEDSELNPVEGSTPGRQAAQARGGRGGRELRPVEELDTPVDRLDAGRQAAETGGGRRRQRAQPGRQAGHAGGQRTPASGKAADAGRQARRRGAQLRDGHAIGQRRTVGHVRDAAVCSSRTTADGDLPTISGLAGEKGCRSRGLAPVTLPVPSARLHWHIGPQIGRRSRASRRQQHCCERPSPRIRRQSRWPERRRPRRPLPWPASAADTYSAVAAAAVDTKLLVKYDPSPPFKSSPPIPMAP